MDINQRNNETFVSACRHGNIMVVNHLFNNVDVNFASDNTSGETPLGLACKTGYVSIVKKLLTHPNIDVNKLSNGRAPLLISTEYDYNKEKVFTMLISRRDIDVNIRNIIPINLHLFGFDMAVDLILKLHKNYVIQELDLQYACRYGTHEHVKKLLVMGATITDDIKSHRDCNQHPIIEQYCQNPNIVHVWGDSAGYLCTLMVCYTDNYLVCNQTITDLKVKRFFDICYQLPIELQMLISHLAFKSTKTIILSSTFTKHAKLILNW